MSGEERDNFDALDEVLGAAWWPEVPGEASARLRGRWEEIARRERACVRTAWGVAAAAAAVLVIVGVWGFVVMGGEGVRRAGPVVAREGNASPGEAAKRETRPGEPGMAQTDGGGTVMHTGGVESRDANAAEVAVALTAARRQGRVVERQEVAQRVKVEAVDVGAELRVIAGKRGEAEALRVLKGAAGDGRVVEELFARLDDPRVEVRLAAARALGYLDGPVVTARLAGMVEGNRNRREALAALMQSGGKEAREYLRRAGREGDVEAAMRSVAVQVRSF